MFPLVNSWDFNGLLTSSICIDRGHVQNTQKALKESIASKLLLLFLCHFCRK